MTLRLYLVDNTPVKQIATGITVASDAEALQRISETVEDTDPYSGMSPITTFVLADDDGLRCVWTRTSDDVIRFKMPDIQRASTRYRGHTPKSVTRLTTLIPRTPYEHNIVRRTVSQD